MKYEYFTQFFTNMRR